MSILTQMKVELGQIGSSDVAMPFEQRLGAVQDTRELRRILALPRRPLDSGEALAKQISAALRTAWGTMELRPIQALALSELLQFKGGFFPINAGGGKAQPNTEPVLTDSGWRPIGSLRVGDLVYGADGGLQTVRGVFPQLGLRTVYKVMFSDGTHARSDIDHLWQFEIEGPSEKSQDYHNPGCKAKKRVWVPQKFGLQVRTLREWMKEPLTRSAGDFTRHRIKVPLCEPILYPAASLPLDPYTLGALIGDGSMLGCRVTFTSMDEDIVNALVLPEGVNLRPMVCQNAGRATEYRISKGCRRGNFGSPNGGGSPNPLLDALRSLGLQGSKAQEKFVPPRYKTTSVDQRLALLQGLMDTDGAVNGANAAFYSTSKTLAQDVQGLAESLGGTGTLTIKRGRYKGEVHLSWRVGVKLPEGMNPFRCARKADVYASKERQREPFRSVVGFEYAGDLPCTCIAVSNPDHLYITRHHVVTHNTLLSLLAPTFAQAQRPLLVVPAALKKKTLREFRELAKHWQCIHPERYEILSYEMLSRSNASAKFDSQGRMIRPGLLETIRPDLIVFDEGHRAKNRKAAVTKKIGHFLKGHPGVKVVVMSGTVTKRSLKDYSHLIKWCLREYSPVPNTDADLDAWSGALDEKIADFQRIKPGALRLFDPKIVSDDTGDENLSITRQAYRDRLTQTPGVVATQDGALGTALQIFPWAAVDCPKIEEAFKTLRTTWATPDGEDFADALSLYRYARQLQQGYFRRWNPKPPDVWRANRKGWNAECRDILKTNRKGLFSELDVVRAVALGMYDKDRPEARLALDAWRSVKGQYDPEKNGEAVWISDAGLRSCAAWAKEHGQDGGIIWTEHHDYAVALAKYLGISYYGARGENSKGQAIEEASGSALIVASVQSNGTGRNLQKWCKNLITSAPPNGAQYEQLLARTHRPGQEADEVQTWIYMGCWEACAGVHQARRDSFYTQDSIGQSQRLAYADFDIPELAEIEAQGGWRWQK